MEAVAGVATAEPHWRRSFDGMIKPANHLRCSRHAAALVAPWLRASQGRRVAR